jgi:hypothetical protein
MENAMISEQLKTRTTKEAGAERERAKTALTDAQAQLVKALTGFDQLGFGCSPPDYLREKPKPLNKSERNTAALAAVAVVEAAEVVERIARDKLDGATAGMGTLVQLMINAKLIQSLMLEVVRTLLRSITRVESPVAVAALAFQAKYLAGMFSRGAEPPDPEDDAEVADCLARRSMQQAT